jgi:ATP-dependent Clp protease ATP-binding subunit ClpC
LNNEDLKLVIDLELGKVKERLQERGLTLELTDDAKEFLIKKGSNLDFGARPLRRAIENFVEDPLAEELLRGEFQGKDTIVVGAVRDDENKIRRLNFSGEFRGESQKDAPVEAGSAAHK